MKFHGSHRDIQHGSNLFICLVTQNRGKNLLLQGRQRAGTPHSPPFFPPRFRPRPTPASAKSPAIRSTADSSPASDSPRNCDSPVVLSQNTSRFENRLTI